MMDKEGKELIIEGMILQADISLKFLEAIEKEDVIEILNTHEQMETQLKAIAELTSEVIYLMLLSDPALEDQVKQNIFEAIAKMSGKSVEEVNGELECMIKQNAKSGNC